MIKINLATRKQSSISTSSTGGGKTSSFPSFQMPVLNMDKMKDLPLRKLGVAILLAGAVFYLESGIKEDQIKEVEGKIALAMQAQGKVKAELDKTKGYDQLKKALEADETTIRTKIDTIRKLIQDRQVPPKLLAALSTGIPEDVWLKHFKISGEAIVITGASLGYGEISDFMKNLGESAYFSDLKMLDAKVGKDDLGFDVSDFQLTAKRRPTGE